MKYIVGGILLGGALLLGSYIGAINQASKDQQSSNRLVSSLQEKIKTCQDYPNSYSCTGNIFDER